MSIRNTKQCPKCPREISLSNFDRHVKACNGPIKTKYPWDEWKIGDNLYQHPDGYIGNMPQVKLYMVNRDGKNMDGIKIYHQRLRSGDAKPWNYGMTIETHPEFADKLGNSTETREKLSKLSKENPAGAVKLWLEGKPIKGRKIYYYTMKDGTEIILDSSWEVQLAKSMDYFDVLWERPKLMRLLDGRSYTPDFYLIDFDVYLDPKFRENEGQNERIKLWEEQYQKRLIIIRELENCK
ncbi:hypothetical protein LCGC14_2003920, partial [marine sediment metagenome]